MNRKKSSEKTSERARTLVALMVAGFVVTLASAEAPRVPVRVAAVLDPSCAMSADPNEGPVRITSDSAYLKDQCVNTARYRPATNVTLDGERKVLVFNNYYFNRQFWKAEVQFEKDAISDVYLQVKKFTVLNFVRAAHVQVRYKLKAGRRIQLTHQTSGEKAIADDVLISFEAGLVKDRGFNVALALMPMNPLVGRVGQTASILADSPRTLDQYPLDLNDEEKRTLLFNTLKRSQEVGLNTFYGTLRPNCATEQFDQLDQLPRLKGRFPRFMVAASPDPVAGPTIEALRARGLITKRIESFQDEIIGKHAVLPVDSEESLLPDFIPTHPRIPWNLVIVSPGQASLSEQDKAVVAALKQELVKYSLEALSSGTASRLFDPAVLTMNAVEELWSSFSDSQDSFDSTIARLASQMSDTEHLIAVYFAPITGVYAPTNLAQYGLDVMIPLPVVNVEYDASKVATKSKKGAETTVRDVYDKIYDGTIHVARKGMESRVPGFLLGAGVELHARKSGSTVSIQTMVGLNAVHRDMNKLNKQVNIRSLDVKAQKSAFETPVAVVSTTIPVPKDDTYFPKLKIQFGPIGKIADLNQSESPRGVLQVWNPEKGHPDAHGLGTSGICSFRSQSVPVLDATFTSEASGYRIVDYFLSGRPVQFRIFSAEVDLTTFAIDDMDVRVDVPPLHCLSLDQVNQQFQKDTNKDVRSMKKKMIGMKIPLKILKRAFGS